MLFMHEDMSLGCQHPCKKLGVVTCFRNALSSGGHERKITGACWLASLAGKQQLILKGPMQTAVGKILYPTAPLPQCVSYRQLCTRTRTHSSSCRNVSGEKLKGNTRIDANIYLGTETNHVTCGE